MTNTIFPTRFVPIDVVAKRYSVSEDSIRRLVREKKFPPGYKIGGSTRWKIADLDEFDENLSTAQPALAA
ncbi:hypothetical protein BVC71_09395 [Marivivens niveibacter]|uniref:Helix-turn-helix domain-containing protein n=1 Tax=Marivivens niveibacter TaxID=1930667 RepID=A0A251WXZ2_9RHOB|nr:helix-turn-helix domain-containing protein [Marivivens niveibacter]OUD08924.1 hypothetical protein BVC71_09395 [Marivivens niveibacter]